MSLMRTAITGSIAFKLRYNVHNNGKEFFWRVFLSVNERPEIMYFVNSIACWVPTFSYREEIEGISHFSMAGNCSSFTVDNNNNATLK